MTKEQLDKLWATVIEVEALSTLDNFEQLFIPEGIQYQIFKEYGIMLKYCKEMYMNDSEGLLDRHKVAAIIMTAILKVQPIKKLSEIYYEDAKKWTFNENLAISTGCSVLRAYILEDTETNDKLTNEQKEARRNKLENGIHFPTVVHHGKDKENYAMELYHTAKEGNYNILAIAHELFYLELTTLNEDVLNS